MGVPADTLALATAFPAALGHRIISGQIVLKFSNGTLCPSERDVPPAVAQLATALRDTFGKPIGVEEIVMNWSAGALQAIERRAEHFGVIQTREYFRVEAKKTLARDRP